MKNKFSVIASVILDPRNRRIEEKYLSAVRNAGAKTNGYLVHKKLDYHFTKSSQKSKISAKKGKYILTCQAKYVRLFLMMYFGYIKKLVKSELGTTFGTNWNAKNTAYVLTLEKSLVDSGLISNNNPKDLLIESGILPEFDNYRIARFIARGEGILPVIRQKLRLKLGLRSYFVLAQIHPTYLQVTLHQVVNDSPTEGHESTIIIKDAKIEMENIVDLISINIWNHVKSDNENEHFKYNRDKKCLSCNLNSLQTYKKVLEDLNRHVSECVCIKKLIYNFSYNNTYFT